MGFEQKRRPARGGADLSLAATDRHLDNQNPADLQGGEVSQLQALHLIRHFAVRPELASALAPLAFGGAR